MKSSLTILALIIVFSATMAFAAGMDNQYLVVVGKTAPASDVVIGANFAASMKATVAVTFASAIDRDVYASLKESDLSSKTIVVIDGKTRTVKIIGTSNAAAAADAYFTQQGFAVTSITHPKIEDVLVNPLVNTTTPTINATANTTVNTTAVTTRTTTNSTNRTKTAAGAANITAQPVPEVKTAPPPAPKAEQAPGVFTRIWRWFDGLFS